MFIKRLMIASPDRVIRDMEFKAGLNLIIDNTSIENTRLTGNNVGKTTVLKLIDFCLGAKSNIIYTDTENTKEVYDVVKNFLSDEEVLVSVTLVDDLDDPDSRSVEVTRNFLQRKKCIRRINGKDVPGKDFEDELQRHIMPDKHVEKPSFRQVISHNIRYKDDSINKTLKTLDKFTTDVEYETLYLYLLGCIFDGGAKKQSLTAKMNQEIIFRDRLEKSQTKPAYEIALEMVEDEIEFLNLKKSEFNLNESLEQDLDQLNVIKYQINKTGSYITKLEIRKSLIEESQRELNQSISSIDLEQLRVLYSEVSINIDGIQKTFEDLVTYHNNMVVEKIKFIVQDLPEINEKIAAAKNELSSLLSEEKILSNKIAKGDSFEELEKIISELNDKYRMKGEYESIIAQLNEVEGNIKELSEQIENIDKYLFSDDFELLLKEQLKKFNRVFSNISQELYGEKYALKYDKAVNKNGQQVYKFNAFNANMSTGKKQGEILCFDLAYILFADKEKIPCMHFLLNDKKKLMHDNQLIKVAQYVQQKNIQLVVSILKDKLPEKVLEKAHVAVELSQDEKLFRIEKKS